MSGLFVAQQVTAAANVQIVTGQLESGTQAIQRLQHLQATLGRQSDLLLGRRRHIGEGTGLGATDPTPELVKLRQAEHIGAVDDQRIGRRNIQAALNNRSRQQHIVLALVESTHHVFKLGRGHLAVTDHELYLRHLLPDEAFQFR